MHTPFLWLNISSLSTWTRNPYKVEDLADVRGRLKMVVQFEVIHCETGAWSLQNPNSNFAITDCLLMLHFYYPIAGVTRSDAFCQRVGANAFTNVALISKKFSEIILENVYLLENIFKESWQTWKSSSRQPCTDT